MNRRRSFSKGKEVLAFLSLGILLFQYSRLTIPVYRWVETVGPSLIGIACTLTVFFLFCERWGVYTRRIPSDSEKQLFALLCCWLIFICLDTVVLDRDIGALRRIVPWFFCISLMILTFRLPAKIVENAAIVALMLLCISDLWRYNQAVFNIHALGLMLLGGRRLGSSLSALLVLYACNSRLIDNDSGLLAGLIALVTLHAKRVFGAIKSNVVLGILLIVPFVVLAAYLPSANSISDRIHFYSWFVDHISLEQILVGAGPGWQYFEGDEVYPHLHCMPITIFYELGIIGVGLAIGILVNLVSSFKSYPKNIQALFVAYGAWSLVDEPIHAMGGMVVFLCALNLRIIHSE